MSNNKKTKREPLHEVNNVVKKAKRQNREEKQKNQGDTVIKWIFGVLIVLAIAYMVWTMIAV
ncbi:MAG: hypothetical protein WCS15_01555 [Prevotella sp.]|nr:hypothetical protein [Prevotella sp.]MDD3388021.1 hypothetical protein [Prevotella sp.]MDD4532948.1 hypothetical protein [Prevotella sp.]MDT3387033.1 hypothetical protein [Bacteroidota bacterium]